MNLLLGVALVLGLMIMITSGHFIVGASLECAWMFSRSDLDRVYLDGKRRNGLPRERAAIWRYVACGQIYRN